MPYGARGQGRGSRKNISRSFRQQRRLALDLAEVESLATADFTSAAIADNYTALITDGFIRTTGVGISGKTITLHGTPDFKVIYILHSYPVSVTLDPAGAVQIDGAATKVIATGAYTLIFDGTAYWTMA